MSFGLLTAWDVEDVPKILRRVAAGYRTVQGCGDRRVWKTVAAEIDAFAATLHEKIQAEIKAEKPKRKRVSL